MAALPEGWCYGLLGFVTLPAGVTSVKPRENPIFSKRDKIVISVKIRNFSRSRMTKRTSPLKSSRKI